MQRNLHFKFYFINALNIAKRSTSMATIVKFQCFFEDVQNNVT